MIENPAKRGDYVLIPRFHSSTMMHGATTRRVTYRIARVTSVTREGLAKRAKGDGFTWEPAAYDRPMIISVVNVRSKYGVELAGLESDMLAGEWSSMEEAREWLIARIREACKAA